MFFFQYLLNMSLVNRYLSVKQRISTCKNKHDITQQIDLLAVSKRHSIDKIKQLYKLGHRKFGESYVNEAVEKIKSLADTDIEWHFIGPLQSNKSKYIAKYFSWVQSVDSLKLLIRLNKQREIKAEKLNVLLQLKVGGEKTKRGLSANELLDLTAQSSEFENLTIRGLMCIPAPTTDLELQIKQFETCHKVFQAMQNIIPVDTLSMGMSSDLEAAIVSKTTMVRIGTDIFGVRSLSQNR